MIDQQQAVPVPPVSGAPAPSPKQIVSRIATEFGFALSEVTGRGRRADVVRARWAAIDAVRPAKPHFSLSQIGQAVGGRDHSTIFHALQKMEREGVPQPPAALRGAPLKDTAA